MLSALHFQRKHPHHSHLLSAPSGSTSACLSLTKQTLGKSFREVVQKKNGLFTVRLTLTVSKKTVFFYLQRECRTILSQNTGIA